MWKGFHEFLLSFSFHSWWFINFTTKVYVFPRRRRSSDDVSSPSSGERIKIMYSIFIKYWLKKSKLRTIFGSQGIFYHSFSSHVSSIEREHFIVVHYPDCNFFMGQNSLSLSSGMSGGDTRGGGTLLKKIYLFDLWHFKKLHMNQLFSLATEVLT